MLKTTVLAVLFAASVTAQEQPPQPSAEEKAFLEMISRPVVYRVPAMDKRELRNDVAYKKVNGQSLFADVYIPRPRAESAKFPAVILIHGGIDAVPVKPKDWGIFRSWADLIAASGMVAVTFNHRLGYPEPRYDQAFSDLADLVAMLRENAEYFAIDGDRIALLAFSGGGPLLSWGMQGQRPYIRALAGFYPILDVEGNESVSPLGAVKPDAKIPPMFIARAGRDQIPNLNAFLDRFLETAVESNVAVTLANHPTAPHGFSTRTNDVRSREIVKMAIDFLRWNLNVSRK